VLALLASASGGRLTIRDGSVSDFTAGQESSGSWIEQSRPKPEAAKLLNLLHRADEDGLNPEHYGLARIEAALADKATLAHADQLLSEMYHAYARDLRVPRNDGTITYIDAQLAPVASDAGLLLASDMPVEKLRSLQSLNPLYTELRAGLARYRLRWSRLPQVAIPSGEPLGLGSKGARVAVLRHRLGLPPADNFDAELGEAVRSFRQVHGLTPLPTADQATIHALNRGAAYYERLIALNLDRLRGLPIDGRRFVVVDTAGARLRMIENGREVDAMRVVVGKRSMETPELAGFIRFAIVNPYWNVPPDLVRHTIAPQVLREGPAYLAQRRFALFADWRDAAPSLDPLGVDWNAVAAGLQKVWVRQLPGGDNMMGEVKFMLPNRLGIYLHDTPSKADFTRADRRLSSGCVRVEDAHRLARWLFGRDPIALADARPELRIDLPQPVPVFITYLTAVAEGGEVRFQKDVYNRDQPLLGSFGTRS
jgi:L,D-transpeptidase YcbB